MWKTFKKDDNLYMLKLVVLEDLQISLTDLKDIWFQNMTKENFIEQFQVSFFIYFIF